MRKSFTKRFSAIIAEVILMASLLSLLTGCFRRLTGNGDGDKEPPKNPADSAPVEMPGELCGIRLETSTGSMEPQSEFEIDVTPAEIVRTFFWPEDDPRAIEMTEKEHVPVTEAQWADLEKIVGILYPLLKPVPEETDGGEEDEAFADGGDDIFVLDGGDYWYFWLTWRTERGEETVQYYQPSDRRVTTLIALLKELAQPIGREIVWYDPPVIRGVYFHNGDRDESFQLTFYDEGRYYFIARWHEDGQDAKRKLTKIVDDSVWPPFGEFLGAQGYGRFPEGWSTHDPVTVTLYYSDGTQASYQPDEAAADALREFFLSKIGDVEKMEKKG